MPKAGGFRHRPLPARVVLPRRRGRRLQRLTISVVGEEREKT